MNENLFGQFLDESVEGIIEGWINDALCGNRENDFFGVTSDENAEGRKLQFQDQKIIRQEDTIKAAFKEIKSYLANEKIKEGYFDLSIDIKNLENQMEKLPMQ